MSLRLVVILFLLSGGACLAESESALEKHPLVLDRPAEVWDEALPLGNGLLGALVWGDGTPLKISLDRTDLWDLRPVPEFETEEYSYALMRQWVKEKRIEDLHRVYDNPYGNAGPTKIPAGRIEIEIPGSQFYQASLPLTCPSATMQFGSDRHVQVMVHATEPVGLIEADNPGGIQVRLIAPPFSGVVTDPAGPNKISAGDLASLGYPAPEEASGENWRGFTQEGWGGFRFAVYIEWLETEEVRGRRKPALPKWRAAWSIATSEEGEDPLAIARIRVQKAVGPGWQSLRANHLFWWMDYWSKSSIAIPSPIIERQWYWDTYKFGAAARRGKPPITLQGPWTADDGKIPPWKGDYHHDLNTELSYWPAYSGNRLDEGLGFLDWLWETRGECEAWTRRFFNLPGLNVPMTADLKNRQIGGWHQYTHSSTTAAWLAHHFYLHWRYSMDREFLENRAYPYLEAVSTFLEAVTENGPEGKRTLPLSSSPEINDNRLEAWFPAVTNYDLALIRWAFGTTAAMALELDKKERAAHWTGVLAEMPDLAYSAHDRRLLIAPDYALQESHRHFSHLMAIHPLGMLTWEEGEESRKTMVAALEEMERLGTLQWTGYSFAWKASIAARAKDGDRAAEALDTFALAFVLRNSFHCNGDQSDQGYSNFKYRPFTLEGNFAYAAGMQEMLLQSYGGVIRVFPAIPSKWQTASFKSLRAEGAFLVSAELKGGKTHSVEIKSEKGGEVRLEDPFAGAESIPSGIDPGKIRAEEGLLLFPLEPNQVVKLTLKEPAP